MDNQAANCIYELNEISKTYGAQLAIDNVSLKFRLGETVLIMGPNGSGKSTLLKILAGLTSLSDGELFFKGTNINFERQKKEISYLGHQSLLYTALSVKENLELFFSIFGASVDLSLVLRRWDLENYVEKPLGELSRGNEYRVALARIFAENRPVKLFDEPTSALDHKGRELFCAELSKCKSPGALSIFASHDFRGLDGIVDRVLVMSRGEVVKDVTGRFKEQELSSLFVGALNS